MSNLEQFRKHLHNHSRLFLENRKDYIIPIQIFH